MNKTVLILVAALAISLAGWCGENVRELTITGVPLHAAPWNELKRLIGPERIIAGEVVYWDYPFAWAGTTENGAQINLKRDSVWTLKGWRTHNGQSEIVLVGSDGSIVHVVCPPNIPQFPLKLVTVALKPPLSCEIVANRLGEPHERMKNKDGMMVWRYKSSVNTEFFSSRRSMIYQGYNFIVSFDASNQVSEVRDLGFDPQHRVTP